MHRLSISKIASILVGLSWVFVVVAWSNSTPSPLPLPSGSPSPVFSGSPSSGALGASEAQLNRILSPADSKSLLSEFIRAQRTEVKAIEHRFQFELLELKASQQARRQEWEKKEREARHHFFAQHSKGADRRVYVQEFFQRRESLLKLLNEERSQRVHEHEVHLQAIRQDQAAKLKDFKKNLEQGIQPSASLWPKPGS